MKVSLFRDAIHSRIHEWFICTWASVKHIVISLSVLLDWWNICRARELFIAHVLIEWGIFFHGRFLHLYHLTFLLEELYSLLVNSFKSFQLLQLLLDSEVWLMNSFQFIRDVRHVAIAKAWNLVARWLCRWHVPWLSLCDQLSSHRVSTRAIYGWRNISPLHSTSANQGVLGWLSKVNIVSFVKPWAWCIFSIG